MGAKRPVKAGSGVNDAQIAYAAAAGNDALLEGNLHQIQGQAHGVALLLHPFEAVPIALALGVVPTHLKTCLIIPHM
jgi:hypothetical protein